MDKSELMLAALAPAGNDELTPVQVQKLLFLIDRNIAEDVGGTGFHFVPYDYGPFDSSVYDVLRSLEVRQLVSSSVTSRGWKKYALTTQGVATGQQHLQTLSPRAQEYIKRVSDFVRTTSFSNLVSAIYKAYPDMKVNSVFRG